MFKKTLYTMLIDSFGIILLALLCFFTWVSFGLIAYGVAFQWVFLIFAPENILNKSLYLFIMIWSIFGFYIWIRHNKKPGH